MDDAAARFRKELEDRTGERVAEVAMANLVEGGAVSDSSWGLLVLTDRSLRFSRPPSRHWVAALIRPSGGKADEEPPEDIVIPLEAVRVGLPRLGFWARTFGPGYRHVILGWEEGGAMKNVTLALDPRAPILKALAGFGPPEGSPGPGTRER